MLERKYMRACFFSLRHKRRKKIHGATICSKFIHNYDVFFYQFCLDPIVSGYTKTCWHSSKQGSYSDSCKVNRNFDTIFYAAGALTSTLVLLSIWSTTKIGHSVLQSAGRLRRVRTQVSHNVSTAAQCKGHQCTNAIPDHRSYSSLHFPVH